MFKKLLLAVVLLGVGVLTALQWTAFGLLSFVESDLWIAAAVLTGGSLLGWMICICDSSFITIKPILYFAIFSMALVQLLSFLVLEKYNSSIAPDLIEETADPTLALVCLSTVIITATFHGFLSTLSSLGESYEKLRR